MSTDHPLMNAKFFWGERALTIGEAYEGHGHDDPPGYYYTFDDEAANGKDRHWISCGALPTRFTKEPMSREQALEKIVQAKATRRLEFVEAARKGVEALASQYHARVIVNPKGGFVVVFPFDDRIYFDTTEM